METVNDPVRYAQEIVDLLEDACYPVANSALKIADVLLHHRLKVEMSVVLAAGRQAAEYQNAETPPVQR